MAFIQRSYPDTTKKVTSIIGDYLIEIGQGEMLSKFDLEPFEIKVQSLERTLVDKVFALCDYFLRGETIRQSRHIYDICQLIKVIDWKNLNDLAWAVRKERMANKTCVSAQPGISIANTLRQIIETEYFKKDYEEVTIALLGEDVSYDTVILALKEISKNTLFDE